MHVLSGRLLVNSLTSSHAGDAGSPNRLMSWQPQQPAVVLGQDPPAAGQLLDADPGGARFGELELASGQLPETSNALLQKFPDDPPTHKRWTPSVGHPRPRPPRPSPPPAVNSQDYTRSQSSPAAQWLEHPQVATTSLDARSSRTATERASSFQRQRPSSGRPPSRCQPFSGQQEARCHNGRSCPLFSW